MNRDHIFLNGKIISVDQRFGVYEAVHVRGGRIVAVGSSDQIKAGAPVDAVTQDLNGRAVLPGLIDGHAHMDREGLKQVYPTLEGARSIRDILDRIAGLVRRAKPGEWIVTMPIGDPPSYWNMPQGLQEQRWPTRWDLDQVSPDNPVFIKPIWGFWRHALPLVSIANSRALEACGLDGSTPSMTESVHLEKDPQGNLTGVFLEHTYMSVVELTLMLRAGRFTARDRVAALERSMREYNAHGTTSVFEEHGIAGEVLSAYQELRSRGPLNVRAHLVHSPSWSTVAGADREKLLATWGAWMGGRGLGDEYLRAGGLYVLMDEEGDGPRSPRENTLRASCNPYTGWAGFYNDAGLPREELKAVLIAAARNNIRCVGVTPDLIDLYEEVNRVVPIRDKRWVLGHISLLTETDIAKARDLGLVMTTHTNRYIYRAGIRTRESIGIDREQEISPLRSLEKAGIPVSLATDNVPVSMFHPIWHAVARRDRSGELVAADQRVSRERAIRAATLDGAFLTFEEKSKGSLEPGKLADFFVCSDDPLTVQEDALKDIVSLETYVGGVQTYSRSDE
ncbi:amidohydrolase [Ottowia thiooxydans]|uniref:Amidohydrolase YtcJ n=1 Tax=Ottowia thiooxydans TaxID=219182 RepID=A0ABV2QCC3_9BURK